MEHFDQNGEDDAAGDFLADLIEEDLKDGFSIEVASSSMSAVKTAIETKLKELNLWDSTSGSATITVTEPKIEGMASSGGNTYTFNVNGTVTVNGEEAKFEVLNCSVYINIVTSSTNG